MASSIARHQRLKNKYNKMPSSLAEKIDDNMVVKSLSVPPGLEALMEGLTKEVLKRQPQDICLFASEYFAKLIRLREKAGVEYQYCKTTIHDKIKKQNAPSRSPSQKSTPKDEVELIDVNNSLSVPPLDIGRYTNGSFSSISPEVRNARSEASTAEIDTLQNSFFEQKVQAVTDNNDSPNMELTAVEEFKHIEEEEQMEENLQEDIDLRVLEANEDKIEKSEETIDNINSVTTEIKENVEEIKDLITYEDKDDVEEFENIIADEAEDANKNVNTLEDELEEIEKEISLQNNEIQTDIKREIQEDSDSSDVMIQDNQTQEIIVQEDEEKEKSPQFVDALINEAEIEDEHSLKKRSILVEEFDALDVPDISTTAATPIPSEEENKENDDLKHNKDAEDDNDGKSEENSDEKEYNAAIKIQSLWRGFKIRKNKAASSLETTDDISENLIKAATTIQTLWRGYNVRKLLLLSSNIKDDDVNEIENEVEVLEEIEKNNTELQEATNTIQEIENLQNDEEEIQNLNEQEQEVENLEENLEAKLGTEIVEKDNLQKTIDEIDKEINEMENEEALEQQYLEDKFEESAAENVEEIEETNEIVDEIVDDILEEQDTGTIVEIDDEVEIEKEIAIEDSKIDDAEIAIISDELNNIIDKEIVDNVTNEVIETSENIENNETNIDTAEDEKDVDTTDNVEEERPKVTFIVGPDDSSDEDDYIKNDLSEAEIAETIIDDVTKSAEDKLNELEYDEDNQEISLDLDFGFEDSGVSGFKDELEIADEISEDLQKLKACITEENPSDFFEDSEQKIESESPTAPLVDNEINEVVDTEFAFKESEEMLNTSRMLEHTDLDDESEHEKLKVAEEIIMKALGLQHSGEMHDSLEFPPDMLEGNADENEDTVDIDQSTKDAIDEIEQTDNSAVENAEDIKEEAEIIEEVALISKEGVIDLEAEEVLNDVDVVEESDDRVTEIQEIIKEAIDNEVEIVEKSVIELEDNIQDNQFELENEIKENINEQLVENSNENEESMEEFTVDKEVKEIIEEAQENIVDFVGTTEEIVSEVKENIANEVEEVEELEESIEDIQEKEECVTEEVQENADNLISSTEENVPEVNENNEVTKQVNDIVLNVEAAVEDVKENIELELNSNETVNIIDETKQLVTDNGEEIEQNIEVSTEAIENAMSNVTIAENELENTVDDAVEEIEDKLADDIVETKDLVEEIILAVNEITLEAEQMDENVAGELKNMEDNVNDIIIAVEENIEEIGNEIEDTVEETQTEMSTAVDDIEMNLNELKVQINENEENLEATPEVLDSNIEELQQDIVDNLNDIEAQIVTDIDEEANIAQQVADEISEEKENDVKTIIEVMNDTIEDFDDKLNDVKETTVDAIENTIKEETEIGGEINGVISEFNENLSHQSNELINNMHEEGIVIIDETEIELETKVDEITKENCEEISSQLQHLEDIEGEPLEDMQDIIEDEQSSMTESLKEDTALEENNEIDIDDSIVEQSNEAISDDIVQNIEEIMANAEEIEVNIADFIQEKELTEEIAIIDEKVDIVDNQEELSEITALIEKTHDGLENNINSIENDIEDEVGTTNETIGTIVVDEENNVADQIESATDAIEDMVQDNPDDVNEISEAGNDVENAVGEEIATKLDNSEINEQIEELRDDVDATEDLNDEPLNIVEAVQENTEEFEIAAISLLAEKEEATNDIEDNISQIIESLPEVSKAAEANHEELIDIIDIKEAEIEDSLIEDVDKIKNNLDNMSANSMEENVDLETTYEDTEEMEDTLSVAENVATKIDEISISELEENYDTIEAELLLAPIITDPEEVFEDISQVETGVKIEELIDDDDVINHAQNIVEVSGEDTAVENVVIDEVKGSANEVLTENQIDEVEHEQDKIVEDLLEITNNYDGIENTIAENINEDDINMKNLNQEEIVDEDNVNKELEMEDANVTTEIEELNETIEDSENIIEDGSETNKVISEVINESDKNDDLITTEIEEGLNEAIEDPEKIAEEVIVIESQETENELMTEVIEEQDKNDDLENVEVSTKKEEELKEEVENADEMEDNNIINEFKESELEENGTEVIGLENKDVTSEIEDIKIEDAIEETVNIANDDIIIGDTTDASDSINNDEIVTEQDKIESKEESQDNANDVEKETDDAEVVTPESTNIDTEIGEKNVEFDQEMVENIENFDKALTDSIEIENKINELNNAVDPKDDVNEELNNNDDINKSNFNEVEAAIKIQSLWRGYQVRNSSDENKTIELQKPPECDEISSRTEENPEVLAKAATTIQAGVRGYLSRAKRHLQETDSDTADSGSQITVIARDSISCDGNDVLPMEEAINKEAEAPKEDSYKEIEEIQVDNVVEDNVNIEPNEDIINDGNVKIIEHVNPEKTEKHENEDNSELIENKADQENENLEDADDKIVDEKLDDIDELNKRLQNLSKTNLYELGEVVEPAKSSSEDLHSGTENKSRLLSPERAINFDEFDSSRYDLKADNLSPRSKPTSPIEELITNAYKIGARLSINDDQIVDAINPVDDVQERAIEYIRIPLHGPSETNEDIIEKKILVPSNGDNITTEISDSNPTEYIYIPLKVPETENTENTEEIGLQHSSEMHDSLGFPLEEHEDDKVGDTEIDNFTNSTGLVHSGEMHDSLVVPADGQSIHSNQVTVNNEVQEEEGIEIRNNVNENLDIRNAEEANSTTTNDLLENPEALINTDNVDISNSIEQVEEVSDFVLGLQHSGELHDSLPINIDLNETIEENISSKEEKIAEEKDAINLLHSSELHDFIIQPPLEELKTTELEHSGELHDSLPLDLKLNNYIYGSSSHETKHLSKEEDDKISDLMHSGEFHDSLDAMINFDNQNKTAFQSNTEFFDSLETNYSGAEDNEEYNNLYPEVNSKKHKNIGIKYQNNFETLNNIVEQVDQDITNAEKNVELGKEDREIGNILVDHEPELIAENLLESLKEEQNIDVDKQENKIEDTINYKIILSKDNHSKETSELEGICTEILPDETRRVLDDLQLINKEEEQTIFTNDAENIANIENLADEENKVDNVDLSIINVEDANNLAEDQDKVLEIIDDEVNTENAHVILSTKDVEESLTDTHKMLEISVTNENLDSDEKQMQNIENTNEPTSNANLDAALLNHDVSFDKKEDHITEKQLQLLKEIDNKNSDSLESSDFEDSPMYDYYDNTNIEMVDTSVSTDDFNFYDEEQQNHEEPTLETIPEMEELHFNDHKPDDDKKYLGSELKHKVYSKQIQQDITSPTKIVDEEEMYKNTQFPDILSQGTKVEEDTNQFQTIKDKHLFDDQITSRIEDISTEIETEPQSTMIENEDVDGTIPSLDANDVDEIIDTDHDLKDTIETAVEKTEDILASSINENTLDTDDINLITYEEVNEKVIIKSGEDLNNTVLSTSLITDKILGDDDIFESILEKDKDIMLNNDPSKGSKNESLEVMETAVQTTISNNDKSVGKQAIEAENTIELQLKENIHNDKDIENVVQDEYVTKSADIMIDNALTNEESNIVDDIKDFQENNSPNDNEYIENIVEDETFAKSKDITDSLVVETIITEKDTKEFQIPENENDDNFEQDKIVTKSEDGLDSLEAEKTIAEENSDAEEELKKNANGREDESIVQDEIATNVEEVINSSIVVENAITDEEPNVEKNSEVTHKENINDFEDAENLIQEELIKKSEGITNYSVEDSSITEKTITNEDSIQEEVDNIVNILQEELVPESESVIYSSGAENTILDEQLNIEEDTENVVQYELATKAESEEFIKSLIVKNSITEEVSNVEEDTNEINQNENFTDAEPNEKEDKGSTENLQNEIAIKFEDLLDSSVTEEVNTQDESAAEKAGEEIKLKEIITENEPNIEDDEKEIQLKENIKDSDNTENLDQNEIAAESEELSVAETVTEKDLNVGEDTKEIHQNDNITDEESIETAEKDGEEIQRKEIITEKEHDVEYDENEIQQKENIKDSDNTENLDQNEIAAESEELSVVEKGISEKELHVEEGIEEMHQNDNFTDEEPNEKEEKDKTENLQNGIAIKFEDLLDSSVTKEINTEDELPAAEDEEEIQLKEIIIENEPNVDDDETEIQLIENINDSDNTENFDQYEIAAKSEELTAVEEAITEKELNVGEDTKEIHQNDNLTSEESIETAEKDGEEIQRKEIITEKEHDVEDDENEIQQKENIKDSDNTENFDQSEIEAKSEELSAVEEVITEKDLNVEEDTKEIHQNDNITDEGSIETAEKEGEEIQRKEIITEKEHNVEYDENEIQQKENIKDSDNTENLDQNEIAAESEQSSVVEEGISEKELHVEEGIEEMHQNDNFTDEEPNEKEEKDKTENLQNEIAIKFEDLLDSSGREEINTEDELPVAEDEEEIQLKEIITENERNVGNDGTEIQLKENINDSDNTENFDQCEIAAQSEELSVVEEIITEKDLNVEEDTKEIHQNDNITDEGSIETAEQDGEEIQRKEIITEKEHDVEYDENEIQLKGNINDSDNTDQNEIATESEDLSDSVVAEEPIAKEESNVEKGTKIIELKENITQKEPNVEGDEKEIELIENNEIDGTSNVEQNELVFKSEGLLDSSVAENSNTDKEFYIEEDANKILSIDNENVQNKSSNKSDDFIDSSLLEIESNIEENENEVQLKENITDEEPNVEKDSKEIQLQENNNDSNTTKNIDKEAEELELHENDNDGEDTESIVHDKLIETFENGTDFSVVDATDADVELNVEEDPKELQLNKDINDSVDVNDTKQDELVTNTEDVIVSSVDEKTNADETSIREEMLKKPDDIKNDKDEIEPEIVTLSRTITPVKSPIEEIDEFLKRSRSRTPRALSRQSNIETPNRQLFDEIDSMIESYEQKKQSSAGSSPLLENLSRSSSRLSADSDLKNFTKENRTESTADLNLLEKQSKVDQHINDEQINLELDSLQNEMNEPNNLSKHNTNSMIDEVDSSHLTENTDEVSSPDSEIKSNTNIENEQKLESLVKELNNSEPIDSINIQLPSLNEMTIKDNQIEIENQAAVKIQNAFKEYQYNKKASKEELLKERSDSTETNKTYIIDHISSPEDIFLDDETVKNEAASKIQNTYRNYRQKRSVPTIQYKDSNFGENTNITNLEDKFLDSLVDMDHLSDVPQEELKDFCDITHVDERNQKHDYKTRLSLDNNALHPNLDSIPESVSPLSAEETKEDVEHEIKEHFGNDTISELVSPLVTEETKQDVENEIEDHFGNNTDLNINLDSTPEAQTPIGSEEMNETPKEESTSEESDGIPQTNVESCAKDINDTAALETTEENNVQSISENKQLEVDKTKIEDSTETDPRNSVIKEPVDEKLVSNTEIVPEKVDTAKEDQLDKPENKDDTEALNAESNNNEDNIKTINLLDGTLLEGTEIDSVSVISTNRDRLHENNDDNIEDATAGSERPSSSASIYKVESDEEEKKSKTTEHLDEESNLSESHSNLDSGVVSARSSSATLINKVGLNKNENDDIDDIETDNKEENVVSNLEEPKLFEAHSDISKIIKDNELEEENDKEKIIDNDQHDKSETSDDDIVPVCWASINIVDEIQERKDNDADTINSEAETKHYEYQKESKLVYDHDNNVDKDVSKHDEANYLKLNHKLLEQISEKNQEKAHDLQDQNDQAESNSEEEDENRHSNNETDGSTDIKGIESEDEQYNLIIPQAQKDQHPGNGIPIMHETSHSLAMNTNRDFEKQRGNENTQCSPDSSRSRSQSRSQIQGWNIDKSVDLEHGELDSGFARDYATDGDDPEEADADDADDVDFATSGIQSESSIYDGDESDAKSSPDDELGQGRHANARGYQDYHTVEERRMAPLEHSGDMNDTVDIFLSSEELSQAGAAMLTSGAVGGTTAASEPTRALGDAQAPSFAADTADDMEAALRSHSAALEQSSNSKSQNSDNSEHATTNMGEGGEHQQEAVAATKIQAGFRGYQVRKQMKLKKSPSEDAKSVKRCSSGRRRSSTRRGEQGKPNTDLEEKSATKIQAGIRGFLVRKRQRNTKDKQA